MKCLLLCVLSASNVLLVLADKEHYDKTEKIINYCLKEANVDDEILDVPLEKMPKEGKCVMACILKNTDVMKVDGTIDLRAAKSVLEKEEENILNDKTKAMFISLLEECAKEIQPVPDDMCDTAYNWLMCQQNKIKSKKKE